MGKLVGCLGRLLVALILFFPPTWPFVVAGMVIAVPMVALRTLGRVARPN